MSDFSRNVTLLSLQEIAALKPELADPIEYRKSGLSLNHIIGCPLDCAYCVRHLFDNFSMKVPRALMSDEAAVDLLTRHRYFQPHRTPIQLFNRATDPMLEPVRPHVLSTLRLLDQRGLTNHVLVITRWKVTEDMCRELNAFTNIKLTILVTHSGIQGPTEPVDSNIALRSLKTLYENARRYRVILYWRPLIPGVNDTDAHIDVTANAANDAHAVVFSGLFYRQEIARHFHQNNLQKPYDGTARRKIFPAEMEKRILSGFQRSGTSTPIFRKTSCGVSYAHGVTDYNGHYGIPELCDICPVAQVERCAQAHRRPSSEIVQQLADRLGATEVVDITDRAIQVAGLDESRRYYIQHSLGYQVHDVAKPHHLHRHGRAEIGWESNDQTSQSPHA